MAFEKVRERWEADRAAGQQRARSVRARLLERGSAVFHRHGVQKVVLFGSVLRGSSTERSDVDLLVIPLAAEHYWEFRHDLEEALEVAVDVYTESDDHGFVRKILERGETVYAAQP